MILLEAGPAGQPALFDGALGHVVAHSPDAMIPALQRLDAARAAGHWVAGYLSYEAGLGFEPRLAGLDRGDRRWPLLSFGIYAAPKPATAWLDHAAAAAGRAVLTAPEPMLTRAGYAAAFDRVKAYIAAGDCYQVNLTFPMAARLTAGTPTGLYGALRARQGVGFGGYCDFGAEPGAGPLLISRSPELFVALDAGGRIEARPMKGTAPRSADPVQDAELAAELRASQKAQAENLMIVDLLRNDISRIARVGTVRVPELFAVQSFKTLHQMSSRVVGQLAAPASLAGVMAALFPCGSITGAPKIRAMQIIAEVELSARGAYCGAMGWMGPDGAAAFNVMIRTLSLFDGGEVVLNVGGGVVQDSTDAGEWEEALWKARYAMGIGRG